MSKGLQPLLHRDQGFKCWIYYIATCGWGDPYVQKDKELITQEPAKINVRQRTPPRNGLLPPTPAIHCWHTPGQLCADFILGFMRVSSLRKNTRRIWAARSTYFSSPAEEKRSVCVLCMRWYGGRNSGLITLEDIIYKIRISHFLAYTKPCQCAHESHAQFFTKLILVSSPRRPRHCSFCRLLSTIVPTIGCRNLNFHGRPLSHTVVVRQGQLGDGDVHVGEYLVRELTLQDSWVLAAVTAHLRSDNTSM